MKLTPTAVLLFLVFCFLLVAIPTLRFPDFDHGDEWADSDLLVTADNFLKFGFIKTRFLPIWEFYDTPKDAYTHYPPLPNLLYAWIKKFAKTESLVFYRGVAVLFSFLGFLAWFIFVRGMMRSTVAAFFASIFYLSNPFFIYGVDSMQASGADALRNIALFLGLMLIRSSPEKRKQWVALIWIALFVESLLSFEYIVYLFLFFVLLRVFFKEARAALPAKVLFAFFLAPVCGFLIHFLQNVWYFESLKLAFMDLKKIALERVASSKDSSLPLTFSVWWQHAISRNFQLACMFKYYVIFPFLILSYFLHQSLSPEIKEKVSRLFRLAVLLVICGLSWYVIFPSHTVAHTFVMFLVRHIVPVASLTFTMVLVIIFYFIRQHSQRKIWGGIILAAIAAVIVITGITQSNLPVTEGRIAQAKDFLLFKECLLQLRSISKPEDEIKVNYYRNPFIRYYTHRRVGSIFDKAALEKCNPLPRFFIFFPYGDQRNMELLEFLQKNYTPLLQSSSRRFPAIFCELNKESPRQK